MQIGERLKNIRQQRKMTLKVLGEQTTLSPSFLCDVEQGRTKPSLKRLEAIADALDTSVAYLMGEDASSEKIPQWISDTVRLLSQCETGMEILHRLSDYSDWSEYDRQEFIQYLRVKNLLRSTETGA
ncbi:helix-turn-helix transcriptional regulator [Oscillospiraceae bacterium PP1C4]